MEISLNDYESPVEIITDVYEMLCFQEFLLREIDGCAATSLNASEKNGLGVLTRLQAAMLEAALDKMSEKSARKIEAA